MFHVLHRITVTLFYACLAGVAFFIYQQRAVFHPVLDFSTALMIRKESDPLAAAEALGAVTKVSDVAAVQLKSTDGFIYNIRLGGLAFPADQMTNKTEIALREEATSKLRTLLMSNQVHVHFTFLSDQRAGVGQMNLGPTNVNAWLVAEGLAKPKRQYLKGLTLQQIYALIRAERVAREHERGIWKKELDTTASFMRDSSRVSTVANSVATTDL